MSNEPRARILQVELQALRRRLNSLDQDVSQLEAIFSQVVTSQEDRLSELECYPHQFGQGGEAICNWLDADETD